MIRFIDLGKQIAVDETDPEWPRQFAFYDTVYDVFYEFGGEQVWDNWKEFEKAYLDNCNTMDLRGRPIERFRNISQHWIFK